MIHWPLNVFWNGFGYQDHEFHHNQSLSLNSEVSKSIFVKISNWSIGLGNTTRGVIWCQYYEFHIKKSLYISISILNNAVLNSNFRYNNPVTKEYSRLYFQGRWTSFKLIQKSTCSISGLQDRDFKYEIHIPDTPGCILRSQW